jgi:D-sedoheptulose 7-phosphate isomerase
MQAETVRKQVVHSFREGAELRLQVVETCTEAILQAVDTVQRCFQQGGKVLLFGNGGSAADAQHIAAEFVGRFASDRIPLAAIALTTDSSALTAIGNDYGFEWVFARQVQALGEPGDVAVAISTSGRSPNILAGVGAAVRRGLTTIAFTGGDGGLLAGMVDIAIVVPSISTPRTQECHITIGHILCEAVETLLFTDNNLEAGDTHGRVPLSCG